MAKDAEVRSWTSLITRSANNLLASVDMAEDVKVGEGDSGNYETIKRLLFSKKLSKPIGYFTSLRSNADSALFAKR